MPFSRAFSGALLGLDAVPVDVEADVAESDHLSLVIVGLPDASVKESKDRVLTAIKNSGFKLGSVHCTVNLAPGDLRKEGAIYDLPIAMGILKAFGSVDKCKGLEDYLLIGELGLSGELRPIQGVLAMTLLARQLGKKGVLLPVGNVKEAAAVPGISVYSMNHLREAVRFFQNPETFAPASPSISADLFAQAVPLVDFADIKGQAHVKRALEIAAAGAHNVVLSGPPGAGKTMMAKALIGIMPELTFEEALEATKVHSAAGLMKEGENIITQRPFRSPHHTISYAGLIGGGAYPRPGEVSLAHHGILFLDEFPEFARSVLEVLRQPLEDRKVNISRANGSFTFPSDFICIAAMNPCPCGNLGHPDKPCKDTPAQVDRYRSKISGPLWDRLDMHIEVPALRYRDIMQAAPGETSLTIRERVKQARKRQQVRFGKVASNGQMPASQVRKFCGLDGACQQILRQAIDVMGISARACDRLLRVALTLADLENSDKIHPEHLMEAINFRNPLVERPQV